MSVAAFAAPAPVPGSISGMVDNTFTLPGVNAPAAAPNGTAANPSFLDVLFGTGLGAGFGAATPATTTCYSTTDVPVKYYTQASPTDCPKPVTACPTGVTPVAAQKSLAQAIADRNNASSAAAEECKIHGGTWGPTTTNNCATCQPGTGLARWLPLIIGIIVVVAILALVAFLLRRRPVASPRDF